jgi:hypothetical protein
MHDSESREEKTIRKYAFCLTPKRRRSGNTHYICFQRGDDQEKCIISDPEFNEEIWIKPYTKEKTGRKHA